MPHAEVSVRLGERSYSIFIGDGLLDDFPGLLANAQPGLKHAVLVFDENVKPLAEDLTARLNGIRVTQIPVRSGESSKSIAEAQRLWEAMLAERADRQSVVIAVGGGVVGDLAGFAAASYARGVPLVQVPTTLLSQVDSSVGGKTGVNLPGAKNMVGAFWQPSLVAIDTATLQSLPTREFVSGLAEVVKYGVILLPELFEYLEQQAPAVLAQDQAALSHLIAQSCGAKARVVQADEHETSGRRAILNYGHTFAHALESVAGYGTWLHGEAVSIGMHMAAHLACALGRVDTDFVVRQQQLLEALRLPTRCSDVSPTAMWDAMQNDKKVLRGQLRFILPAKLGHVDFVSDVDRAEVLAAIKQAM